MSDKLDPGTGAAAPPPREVAREADGGRSRVEPTRGRQQKPDEPSAPPGEPPSRRSPPRLPRLEAWPVLLTLIGFALYSVVRVCQVTYAGRLGLRPEDLGLGYSTSISGAAALAGFVVISMLSLYILIWTAFAVNALFARLVEPLSENRLITRLSQNRLIKRFDEAISKGVERLNLTPSRERALERFSSVIFLLVMVSTCSCTFSCLMTSSSPTPLPSTYRFQTLGLSI